MSRALSPTAPGHGRRRPPRVHVSQQTFWKGFTEHLRKQIAAGNKLQESYVTSRASPARHVQMYGSRGPAHRTRSRSQTPAESPGESTNLLAPLPCTVTPCADRRSKRVPPSPQADNDSPRARMTPGSAAAAGTCHAAPPPDVWAGVFGSISMIPRLLRM